MNTTRPLRINTTVLKPYLALSLAALLLCLTLAPAMADDSGSYAVPKTKFLRFEEDWSSLKGIPRDQLKPEHKHKFIALSDTGNIWVSFGGHTQFRVENWNNFDFGAPLNDQDTFLIGRGLFHADWHFGDNLRIFSEFKHADITDRDLPGGERSIDVDKYELQQLFVDYKIPLNNQSSLTLRAGRQEYAFGKQRLISPLPWANALRHWDGLTAIFENADFRIHGFYSKFVPVQRSSFNNADADNLLFGINATQKLSANSGIDYYWYGIDRANRSFNGTQGDENRHTLGVRHWGKYLGNQLDYEVEAAWQTGEVGNDDISAGMFTGVLGYQPLGWSGKPRFSLGFDYASGDDEAGGSVGTFNQLFPLGHAYLGFIDIVGRQNIIDFHPGVKLSPFSQAVFGFEAHFLSRANRGDAFYNAGGGIVRPADPNAAKTIGTELDFTFNYKFTPRVSTLVGFSYLFAGDFLEDTGSSENIRFFYTQLIFTF